VKANKEMIPFRLEFRFTIGADIRSPQYGGIRKDSYRNNDKYDWNGNVIPRHFDRFGKPIHLAGAQSKHHKYRKQ